MEMSTVSDIAYAALSEEIVAASTALLELVDEDPSHLWHPYDLKTRVRNGWSAGAVSLALNGLIEDGTLELHEGHIRRRQPG